MNFIDLKQQYARIREQVDSRIAAVFEHGRFVLGPEVSELEERLAAYVGCRCCVSCANGTDALLLALMAHGVGPGDLVLVPAFTFIATAEVVRLVGATPVFVDIDPRTYTLDPASLAAVLEQLASGQPSAPGIPSGHCPRGIIAVDLFGIAADYDALEPIAREHGLFVLEDAAQSVGGSYRGRKAGALAPIAATSFYPAKPLGCYGEGGALFVEDERMADRMVSLRDHGSAPGERYTHERIGLNARLDTLQAAVLLAKLEVFDDEVAKRQAVAERYQAELDGAVIVPVVPHGCTSVWAQYSIRTENRDGLVASLRREGVPTAIHYPTPLHLQPAFASLGYGPGSFPVSEACARTIVSLPMHPYLSEDEQVRVCEAVRRAVGRA
jgi:UDP-2-acetamido-2-deoxy-ribo-hexuluronate aminotransferase